MTTKGLEIAHITSDGKEIDVDDTDDKKDINTSEITTQKAEDVLAMLQQKKPIFIKFYAVWCGHCKTMAGPWKKLIEEAKKKYTNKNIAIVEVEEAAIKKLSAVMSKTKNMNEIRGFPTIGTITYDNNGNPVYVDYMGGRDLKSMLKAVDNLANSKSLSGGGKKRSSSKRSSSKRSSSKRSSSKRSSSKRSSSKRSSSKRSSSKRSSKRRTIKRRKH
jgi:thiol-disulfide isomerase/thioredoxin